MNGRVRRIDAAGIIGTIDPDADGLPATSVYLAFPAGIAVGAAGDLYIADIQRSRVRKVDAAGVITTVAGNPGEGFSGDGGLATAARLRSPGGLAFDAAGNLYIADTNNHRVRKVDTSGVITTVAGDGSESFHGDGGPATQAGLPQPWGLAFDATGNLYVASSYRVRMINPAGVIVTVAGNGSPFAAGTGPAPALGFSMWPRGLAVDAMGNLYIGDQNNRVFKVDGSGMLTVFAGGGNSSAEGVAATSASLVAPQGVAVATGADGNVYIAEGARVRMVSPAGVIATVAGTNTLGFSGDGGAATAAQVREPLGIVMDPAGFLYIADTGNGRVRRVALEDVTPGAFAFVPATAVAVSATVQSAAITPTGFSSAAPVSISGGEYAIGCTGTFVSTAGSLSPGQSICVRHTSAAANNADTTTVLTLGGREGRFTSTTVAGAGSIALSLTALDFGGQSMRTSSPAQSITLTNTSGATVSVNAVSTSAHFGATHDCASLAPAGTCTVLVTFTPGAEGALAGTLTLQNSPGTQAVSLAGTGQRSLAVHYYRAILGRAPDAAGQAFWDGEAARLTALGARPTEAWFAMAMNFYFSAEYTGFNRTNAQFLNDLYATFFNRAPEATGLGFWLDQLAAGLPREVVLAGFMFSPEFVTFSRNIFGLAGARAEVDTVMDFYRGLLARVPETAGFNNWVQRFRTAQCAVPTARASAVRAEMQAISSEFINSSEYLGRNRSDAQFVGDMYNAFFRRGGELAGVQAWMNHLGNGLTRDQVRDAIIRYTPEFTARVNAIVTQGCLP